VLPTGDLVHVADMLLREQTLVMLPLFKGMMPEHSFLDACRAFGMDKEKGEDEELATLIFDGIAAMFKKESADPKQQLNCDQCHSMRKALKNSLIPEAVYDPVEQAKLDEKGFYGLTTDIRRVTHVDGIPVNTPDEACKELDKAIEKARGSKMTLSQECYAEAPETDDHTEVLLMLLAAVHTEGLKDKIKAGLLETVLDQVVHQCMVDLDKSASKHEDGARRLDVDYTKLDKTEQKRIALNKDMDEFELKTHKEFMKFLADSKALVSCATYVQCV